MIENSNDYSSKSNKTNSTACRRHLPPEPLIPSRGFESDDVPFTDYDEYDGEVFKLPSFKSLATWVVCVVNNTFS